MTDPPDEAEGTGRAVPRSASNRQPCDPPEVGRPPSFELPPTAGWHRAKSRRILVDHAEDHHLEFEVEGLVPPSNEASPRRQFPRRPPRSSAGRALSSALAAWSAAWSPRHRVKSGFCLILAAFVLLVNFGPGGGGGSLLGRSSSKGGGRKADPLGSLSNEQRISLLKEVYGTWTFYDGSADDRPRTPYVTEENAGNRFLDLPEDKFPPESWQADAVYANHFLDAAIKLVRRAQRAIYSAYAGYGLSDVRLVEKDDGSESFEFVSESIDERRSKRVKMFHLEEVDLSSVASAADLPEDWHRMGGWTTTRSLNGLERRITHRVMTNTEFTVLFAGGWRSLGYGGNHAWQGMPAVFESLLSGIFDRLGVQLVVRTVGLPPLDGLGEEAIAEMDQGGRSNVLSTLGFSSLLGSDVDMVVWDDYGAPKDRNGLDAPPAEPDDLGAALFDLFARQALLAGETTAPFLWGGSFEVLRNLHEHADVDVGQLGSGIAGVPVTTSLKVGGSLPLAAQYLNCPAGTRAACDDESLQFDGTCWIERSDFVPETPQLDPMPVAPSALGWRAHQLRGYTLAYNVLNAVYDALDRFSVVTITEGFPLPDEDWHVGPHVTNILDKVRSLSESDAPHCFTLKEKMGLPQRLCKSALRGRTEYTPRADPASTSIRGALDDSQRPDDPPGPLYKGDDIENPLAIVPDCEVDAIEIVNLSGKRRRRRAARKKESLSAPGAPGHDRRSRSTVPDDGRRDLAAIEKGTGWQLLHSYGDGCDGRSSSSHACGRVDWNDCLLSGHQGSRGGVWGNETTGWLVMYVNGVENGFVGMNVEIGARGDDGGGAGDPLEALPETFVFEHAVDGIITSLDRDGFLEKARRPSLPGTAVLVLLDDESKSGTKDMVASVRVSGCPADERACQFAVTHLFWS